MALWEWEYSVMSDLAEAQSRSTPEREDLADKKIFAQVEKWMVMIREFNHERQGQAKAPRLSDLPEFSTE
jgi:hypothetical protein